MNASFIPMTAELCELKTVAVSNLVRKSRDYNLRKSSGFFFRRALALPVVGGAGQDCGPSVLCVQGGSAWFIGARHGSWLVPKVLVTGVDQAKKNEAS